MAQATKQNKGGSGPNDGSSTKGDEIIGITTSKAENFPQWYQEVVLKADMVEYYQEVSGLFVLRPLSMFIWNVLRKWFQGRLEEMAVEEASFPLFLTSKSLEKEKDHIEGFAPELAWVTKAQVTPFPSQTLQSRFQQPPYGTQDLDVPVAIRPTSEAIMYPYFAKWIRSHRDLPLRLNQWNSVVRWETKQTTPFLRTREFLWQEGHTAHLTEESAAKEVREVLEHYRYIYEELLAVPMVAGRKTENERFAGGYYTLTLEGYIPSNGRGIQGATSHCLGQNFSKMFNISVEDPQNKGSHQHVWQNSWAYSTRAIGVMVMIHGDDKGLVLPPRVAQVQVIIVPVGITKRTSLEDRTRHFQLLQEMVDTLRAAGVRTDMDLREGYTPAWKFNEWELKGVPLRIEFGPRDAANDVVTFARRDSSEGKGTIKIADLATEVPALLERIQEDMFLRAETSFREHRLVVTRWVEVLPALDNKNVVLIPFCLGAKCEDRIKELTTRANDQPEGLDNQKAASMGMKSLCVPFDQPETPLVPGETKCLNSECDAGAKTWTMFGRSY